GAVTVEAGGKAAPGASIGTLNAANWVWSSDNLTSGMLYELNSLGNTSDQLNLSGAFTKGAGTSFLWDFSGGLPSQTYTLINFGSTTFSQSDFAIATSGYIGTFTLSGGPSTPGNLQFTLIAVP